MTREDNSTYPQVAKNNQEAVGYSIETGWKQEMTLGYKMRRTS